MEENLILAKIGAEVIKLRMLNRMTQNDLAAKCNFEKSDMEKIEAGETDVTISALIKICNVFDVDFKVLLN